MRQTPYKDFLLLAASICIFSFITINIRPLGVPDEGRYTSIAYAMYNSGDYITPLLNGVLFIDKPPLYYWLEALSFHIFGLSPWAARIPPVLLGASTTLFVFATGYRFFNRTTAYLASLVLATSPFWYGLSQYANMDIEVAAWISMSLFTIVFAINEISVPKRKLFFNLAWIFSAMATLTKGIMGLFFPVLVLGVYFIVTRGWRKIRSFYFFPGAAIYLLLCLPWLMLMQYKHPDFFRYFFITQQIGRFLSDSFNNLEPFWFYTTVILAGLFPWSLLIPVSFFHGFRNIWKRKINTPEVSLTLYLLLWIILIFLFFSWPASKPVGYILPVFPPLALFIAIFLDEWGRKRKVVQLLAIFSMIAAIGLALISRWWMDHQKLQDINKIKSALYITSIIGVVFSIMAILEKKRINTYIWLMIFPSVLCVCLPFVVSMADKRGLSFMLKKISPCVNSNTRVINFDRYAYDLPLLLKLKKPMTVVANWENKAHIMESDTWKRELLQGAVERPEARQWLITKKQFTQMMKDKNIPVIIIAREQSRHFLEKFNNISQIASYYGTYIFSQRNNCSLTYDKKTTPPL